MLLSKLHWEGSQLSSVVIRVRDKYEITPSLYSDICFRPARAYDK